MINNQVVLPQNLSTAEFQSSQGPCSSGTIKRDSSKTESDQGYGGYGTIKHSSSCDSSDNLSQLIKAVDSNYPSSLFSSTNVQFSNSIPSSYDSYFDNDSYFSGYFDSTDNRKMNSQTLNHIEEVFTKVVGSHSESQDEVEFDPEIIQQENWDVYNDFLRDCAEDYKRIRSYYHIDENGFLQANSQNETAYENLTEDLLKRIVLQCDHVLFKSEDQDVQLHVETVEGKKISLLAGKSTNDPSSLEIDVWSGDILQIPKKDFLGQGGFGRVQKVHRISIPMICALKVSCPKDERHKLAARNDIINEQMKLQAIHECEPKQGLQFAPLYRFTISYYGENEYGILQPLYTEGSLKSYIKSLSNDSKDFTPKERLFHSIELLKGLRALHKKGIIHGDIKSDNIFVGEVDGKRVCHLADLGGSKNIYTELLLPNYIPSIDRPYSGLKTSFTPSYFTKSDDLYLKQTAFGENRNQDEWHEFQVKRDQFALSKSIWYLLTAGNKVYGSYTDDQYAVYPDTSKVNADGGKLIEQDYGGDVYSALVRSLSEDPNDRGSLDDLINTMEARYNEMV